MPVFEYTALDINGKRVSDIIDAESGSGARQKLRQKKLFPVEIKEVHDRAKQQDTQESVFVRPFSRISSTEISIVTRQMATLVGAGFPLVSAIYALIPQTSSNALKKVLSQIKDSIEEGNSFAGSLSRYPDLFSSIYINMVRAGETSGTLEIVLERLADITEKQQILRGKIKAALTYPILMTFIGSIVLFTLLAFIVPKITAIFADMNQTLPTPTVFLINLSTILKNYWWLMAGGLFVFFIGFKRFKNTVRGRFLVDKYLMRSPVIGALIQKLAIARFSRTLGSLLENGVSMLSALDIVTAVVGNVIISNTVKEASVEVEKGNGLGNALDVAKVFPHIAIQMIQVGEQSGELEGMLNKIADIYENEVEMSVTGLTALLDPIILIVMGITVGFIVLAVLLPIFEMNQIII